MGEVAWVGHQAYSRGVADSLGAQDGVLEGAAEPDMHLAAKRVDGADVAVRVGKQVDTSVAHPEKPGLTVVRVGVEDGGLNQRQRPVGPLAAPMLPRFIGCAPASAEDAPVGSAVDPAARDQEEGGSAYAS